LSKFKAIRLMMAKFSADCPFLFRDSSSLNWTSKNPMTTVFYSPM
jgi:hypothetical protein